MLPHKILEDDLITVSEASLVATKFLNRQVTKSNISYLIQYGRIKRFSDPKGASFVSKNEVIEYYNIYKTKQEDAWKQNKQNDVNWHLSFSDKKESETTRHVHRLHPYKGKFIPHLVEYFLDEHTDEFKKDVYFQKGDFVLDPFCGSGTTLVQANELGINGIGIDISPFNALISNCKISKYNLIELRKILNDISVLLKKHYANSKIADFENDLNIELSKFNKQYFPTPEFKFQVRNKTVDEVSHGKEKESEFLEKFNFLKSKHHLTTGTNNNSFLDKWYFPNVKAEVELVFSYIKQIENPLLKKITSIILSRTIRSCRATMHSDLATLIEPVKAPYYCIKHFKICKPIFTITKWWDTYSKDTLNRLANFDKLRTDSFQHCITGDSRSIDVFKYLESKAPETAKQLSAKKFKGIFSSPPYVGLINYHEQHAYAYELFGFERNDELEIGSMFKGSSKNAQKEYADGISNVLLNCRKFLAENADIFLVANDKFNLYPTIAENAGLKIINKFNRPVLNRTEKDKAAYSESIFHMKVSDE